MNLTFQRATESQQAEIYALAGVNREEATNHVSTDSREKMIEAYEHSAKFGAYFLCLVDDETLIGWTQIDKAFDYLTGGERPIYQTRFSRARLCQIIDARGARHVQTNGLYRRALERVCA